MEENIKKSASVDRDEGLKALDYKKRNLGEKIKYTQKPADSQTMKRHVENNTVDGQYLGSED